MAVCAEYRIPHSRFLGWEASDRDKAIWWHIRQREACPSCGTRRDEWDPKKGGRTDAYVASARRCHGCEAVAKHREQLPDGIGHGVQIVLKPND
ncbi:MAG: hypothetical protein ACRDMV_18070 [Streptosporangiales bacterium]